MDKLNKLNELFGSYRAEWLRDKIYDYFLEPSYFLALQDNRPCVLQGGRGTGKTTVLRGLSYKGRYALYENNLEKFDADNFIGIYHRVNTNHVRAFVGNEIDNIKWQKIFGHYFNLLICYEVLKFIKWHSELSPSDQEFSPYDCNIVAKSVHIEKNCRSLIDLLESLEEKMYSFQSEINNISDDGIPKISMPGDPIKILTKIAVNLHQFQGKIFYFLIDEYENYEDNQQQLVNTLIKHNDEQYTFKVGVRELGWRVKHTLNKDELLHDPADYALINIESSLTEGSKFSEFAKNVCQKRIAELCDIDEKVQYSIDESLQSLTIEKESLLLNIEKTLIIKEYNLLPNEYQNQVEKLSLLYKFFISYWGKHHDMSLEDSINAYVSNKSLWDSRYENYKYAMLFKIKKGRGSGGIQKYYAGWKTYIKLASGNIRYLMELVYKTYEKHINDGLDLSKPVSYKNQTLAAQDVGLKNLKELEGLWKNGSQLTKLLYGFGRIFNVLAREDGKLRAEVNQLSIEGEMSQKCEDIMTAAVMNLALLRIPGNKLSKTASTKEFIYTLHPIFAPYLGYSYRKKRKMVITADDIIGIINSPEKIIKDILGRNNINSQEEEKYPNQMSLFDFNVND